MSKHWHEGPAKSPLGTEKILAAVAWIVVFLVINILNLVAAHQLQHDGYYYIVLMYLRFITVLLAAGASACYLRVGFRLPRPRQLHLHGIALLMILPEVTAVALAESLEEWAWNIAAYTAYCLAYIMWGARRCLLVDLMVKKLQALGAPATPCLDALLWGRVLIASTVTFLVFGLGGWWILRIVILVFQTDMDSFDLWDFSGNDLPTASLVGLNITIVMRILGALGTLVGGSIFLLVARRLINGALKRLGQRQVTDEPFEKARSTLRYHWIGLLVSTLSNILLVAPMALIYDLGLVPEEVAEISEGVQLVDVWGDALGIMLLSGIGQLLVREDPEAGDVSGHIWSLLLSAVLTSRANNAFEGHVVQTKSGVCIASFPGKYLSEWNALTWLCEQGEISSACVFLPKSDPKERFGKHHPCPDILGCCWCSALYGEVKPWGCLWFEAWRLNVEEAVRQGLDLIVVFFPQQAGEGQVAWTDLGTSELWDGVGLGGSQKAEVAYLARQGYAFKAEGLDVTRRRIKMLDANRVPSWGAGLPQTAA